MTNIRSPTTERGIVFGNPEKRRYGARLVFQVLDVGVRFDRHFVELLVQNFLTTQLRQHRQKLRTRYEANSYTRVASQTMMSTSQQKHGRSAVSLESSTLGRSG